VGDEEVAAELLPAPFHHLRDRDSEVFEETTTPGFQSASIFA